MYAIAQRLRQFSRTYHNAKPINVVSQRPVLVTAFECCPRSLQYQDCSFFLRVETQPPFLNNADPSIQKTRATVTGSLMTWAQPIKVGYQKSDLSSSAQAYSTGLSTTFNSLTRRLTHAVLAHDNHTNCWIKHNLSPSSSKQSLSAGTNVGIGRGVALGNLVLLGVLTLVILQ